METMTHKI